MALIRVQSASVAFGAAHILDKVSLSVDNDARVALVGRNGEGKSTLLKLLGGMIEPDSGTVVRQSGLQTAYLTQAVPHDLAGSIYSIVASGLSTAGQVLADYHDTLARIVAGEDLNARLGRLQDQVDAVDGWSLGQQVEQVLSRMGLDGNAEVATLSGGMKRRVLLAKALVTKPDILLLDEPTNHLDIGAIGWLEEQLASLNCSVIFVTHDRSFLDVCARSIIELDRGQLTEWPGNFSTYKIRKAEQLEVESGQNALFDKKLAQEETWIRQGIKARRTRNEGRVRALKKLREQHRQRRSRPGDASMNINQAERSGKTVLEAKGISFSFEDNLVIDNLDLTILRQDRIGIIGPNGCGKSTLINLIVGNLTPTAGQVEHGTRLEIAYFDQLRTDLDTNKSAAENVSGGKDSVLVNGKPKHIMGYMQDFLFEPARARAPITALSGGELGRLKLAKLFLQPSNLIIMDEPSNDLDIETLELLEALLADYQGTVIMISHDRELLENVVTRSLVFQGSGKFVDVAGGWSDFERERATSNYLKPVFEHDPQAETPTKTPTPTRGAQNANVGVLPEKAKGKLSYKLQRELDALPASISEIETRIASLEAQMAEADFYSDSTRSQRVIDQSERSRVELEALYARWEELEAQDT